MPEEGNDRAVGVVNGVGGAVPLEDAAARVHDSTIDSSAAWWKRENEVKRSVSGGVFLVNFVAVAVALGESCVTESCGCQPGRSLVRLGYPWCFEAAVMDGNFPFQEPCPVVKVRHLTCYS